MNNTMLDLLNVDSMSLLSEPSMLQRLIDCIAGRRDGSALSCDALQKTSVNTEN